MGMPVNAPLPAQANLDQFLQPQSMVTPGILGTVAMLGTNSACQAFSSNTPAPYIILGLSFLFGLITVLKTYTITEKVVYWVVNSVIILSVASGTNSIGRSATHTNTSHGGFGVLNLISPAYAQSNSSRSSSSFFSPWFGGGRTDVNKESTIPYRIDSIKTGTCSTVYLPSDDPNASASLKSGFSADEFDVQPGACSDGQTVPPNESGFIFVGDRKSDGQLVSASNFRDGNGNRVEFDNIQPGQRYTLVVNLTLRAGQPENDRDYFRGQKSLGVLQKGSTVQVLSPVVDIVRSSSLTQSWVRVRPQN